MISTMAALALVTSLAAGTAPPRDGGRPPAYLNLSFEAPDPLDGWFANGNGFAPAADRTRAHSGATCLGIRYTGKGAYDPSGRDFANVSRRFPVADARGKTLRLRGHVRTENVNAGYAGFWCRVDGRTGTLAIDNMGGRGVTGTSDWTPCEIALEVDAEATGIAFGAILAGDGAAWFDSISFEIDGVPYPQGDPPPATTPKEVVDWIRAAAIPLRSAAPGSGFDDMRPLRALVGDARIVSLGEATHGTREFFQWKHRMLEFLVAEMGFTIFAIEANAPECAAIDDYVMGKDVDPEKALDGIYFWTWNTEEVLDMMRWMRAHNADPRNAERKVRFLGFDAQTPNVAVDRTLEYLAKVDPESAAAMREPLEALKRPKAELSAVPPDESLMTQRALADAIALFDGKKDAFVAKSSEPEWADARQCAVVARQTEEVLRTSNFAARDRAMADNVKWILDRAGADSKVVLWAHNGHVSTNGYAGFESMGVHLRREYGAAMVVIGFAFNQGSFQAIEMASSGESRGRGLRAFTVPPAPASSLDGTLAATGLPLLVLDLRKVPASGAVADWFAEEQRTRSIGAAFADGSSSAFLAAQKLRDEYDAIFFVETTTRARPNASVRKRFNMDEGAAPAK